MPVYEYECSGCQKVFEMQQRMADEPISVCPQCGGSVRKLISMSSFQLKGGGWHTDGYGNGKSPCADSGAAPPCSGAGDCYQCPAAT